MQLSDPVSSQPGVLCHSNNVNSILGVGLSNFLRKGNILKTLTSTPNWETSAGWFCPGNKKIIIHSCTFYSSVFTDFNMQFNSSFSLCQALENGVSQESQRKGKFLQPLL